MTSSGSKRLASPQTRSRAECSSILHCGLMSHLKHRADLHSLKGQIKVLKPQFLIQGSAGLKLTLSFPGTGFSSVSVWFVCLFGGFCFVLTLLTEQLSCGILVPHPPQDQTQATAALPLHHQGIPCSEFWFISITEPKM